MTHADRRTLLLRGGATLALAAIDAGCARLAPVARTHEARTELLYAGTQGSGLHALRFDPDRGTLAVIGAVTGGARTTWSVAHPRLPILYAVDDDSAREGSVIAYAVERASGALARIGAVAAGGKGTTYLWLDVPSMTLLAANFGSGSVSSIALEPDGRLGRLVSTVTQSGSGPHRRQASAHAHGVAVDPWGKYALVPDLGADRVFIHGFDRATRMLAADGGPAPRSLAVAAGSGPRHLAFGADGRFVYLLNELGAQVATLRWDPVAGRLAPVEVVSINGPDFAGAPSGAEIAVGAGGRVVYVANRGEHTLLVYRVDPARGTLRLLQRTPSGGKSPWSFALHASGRWLLVANQGSAGVNLFGIDPATGLLADSGRSVAVPAPVSLTFVG